VSETKPVVILCVDDDPKALMARRLVLSSAGYDVLAAGSGEDALRILRRREIHLVITDAFLPRFSAAEITSEIKRLNPRVPVVLLAGAPELPPGAIQADLVLVKGMAPSDFLAEVARLLREESLIQSAAAPDGGC